LNETDIRIKLPGAQKDIPYAAVGGMFESLSPKARGVNLLSRGRYEMPKTPFGLTLALTLSLLALLVIYMVAPLRVEGRRLGEIDRQIAARKDEVRKVEALKKEIDELNTDITTIMNFKEGKPKALDIVKELTTILPKTTWLTRVRVTDTTVEIEGYASSATEMLPKLEASKLFKKAEFASPTFRDARMNSDRFVIKMEIEGIKKPEGEGPKNAKK
jgi:general secretion pathway protein L